MKAKGAIAAALVLLLFSACSSGQRAAPGVANVSPTTRGAGAEKGAAGKKATDKKASDSAKKRPGNGGDPSSSGAPEGRASEPGDGGGNGGTDGSSGTSQPSGDGSAPNGRDTALYPAAGDYSYAQKGYREFCSGTCDREALPARATTSLRVTGASTNGATVVSEQNAEEGTVRMTTDYKDRDAHVSEVYTRFAYEGFEFEKTYRPDPPVLSLSWPLDVGRHWEGSWDAEVSGDYEAAVAAREPVVVGGETVQALKVFTVTRFRGDFKGRSDLVVWIDPGTLAIVKTKGFVHLESGFGTYNTKFSSQLLSGPRYP
jgi:hypothetical protein